jgi:putative transposase
VAFVDANRSRRSAGLVWGVEPICRVLQVAPSTYYAAKKRPPSARAVRDEQLKVEIRRVYEANFMAYGADKIWDQLNKDGIRVARCTVERLTRTMGITGVTRENRFKPTTTVGDESAARPLDLVQRRFRAPAPNRLWVADLTYVKTHAGWVYVAFIIDVFSRFVVGWQASRLLRSDLAIDALEMAIWNRQRAGADLSGLIHHSDRGVQGGFTWLSQHPEMEVLRGGVQASSCAGGPRDAGEDVVAWPTVCGATRGSGPVLDGDCPRPIDRRRCRRDWRVIRGRGQVVPGVWRDAVAHVGPGVGPLPVLRRARGDRNPACAAARRA